MIAEAEIPATPSSGLPTSFLRTRLGYISSNLRQKAEIMGSVMVLSAAEAAKFWPIYEQYDAGLNKLNDQRVANIEEYTRTYDNMTDEKADELIKNAMAYRKQRSELLEKTYERMK